MVGASGGSFDGRVISWVADHRTDWADNLTRTVMYVGTTPWCIIVGCVAALVVVVWLRAYRAAMAGVVAVVAANAAAHVLKTAFGRPRPPTQLALVTVGPPSFPSSQAAMTSALALAVLVAFSWSTARTARLVSGLVVLLVVFVGICLVYLGAHWPTDVLAGWLLGGLVGAACGRLARLHRRRPSVGT